MENGTQVTLQESEQMSFLAPTFGAQASLVRTSQSQERPLDSKESVQACFSQLQDLLKTSKKKINPLTYSLRTLKTYLALIEGLISPDFSLNWTKSGTMQNGSLSTLPIMSRKTARESTLSDILEAEVDEKYFLSQAATERILSYKDKQSIPLPHEQGGQQPPERTLLKINSMHKEK